MTNVQQVRAKAPNKVVNLPSPYSGVSATRHGSVGVNTDLTAISTLISGNQLEVVPDPDAPLAGPDYAAQEFVTHEELEAALSGLGGGGSSFAYITEENNHVKFDHPAEAIGVNSRFSATGVDREGPTAEIQGGGAAADSGLWIWNDWSDNTPVVMIDAEGVISFGPGGADAADMRIYRDGAYSISMSSVKDSDHGGFEWWNEDESGDAYFYMFGQGGAAASIQFDTRENHPIIYASDRDGHYASLGVAGNDKWKIDGTAAALMFGDNFKFQVDHGALALQDNDGGGLVVSNDGTYGDNARGIAFFSDFIGIGGAIQSFDATAAHYATLQLADQGVWEVPEHGGGLKLTSPDGSQTKTIRLSNAGAVELV